jgi:hypothetical protein
MNYVFVLRIFRRERIDFPLFIHKSKRMNPIRMAADYLRRERAAAELLASVRYAHTTSRGGIDIPNHDDPVMVAAVMSLLKKHLELTVVKLKKNLMLAYRDDVHTTISPQLLDKMTVGGFFARPDEDLIEKPLPSSYPAIYTPEQDCS